MKIVVQKYGGSSVADLEKIRGVARRIAKTRAAGLAPVVVVSAMGNTTNELLALAREVTSKPDRRELDMLISVGERIAMSLVAMALRELDVPAVSLTGSQSGIITDEAHADARVVEVRPSRVQKHLDEGAVVIVAGFQGVSREREVTTLGRGGSDTTAVVLAAALDAEYCEICSDVDGVWSADPRVVEDAKRIDHLSLSEGVALARGGAKVLFEDALRYARDQGVEVKASTTFGPGSGTRLSAEVIERAGAVAITADTQLRRARLVGRGPTVAEGLKAAGARLRRREGAWLWLDMRNAHGGIGGLEGIVDDGATAVVTAVGSGVGERMDVVLRGEAAVGRYRSCGAAGDAAWWEVEVAHANRAARALHAALVPKRRR